jgi:hypothetical protein
MSLSAPAFDLPGERLLAVVSFAPAADNAPEPFLDRHQRPFLY